MRKLTLAAILVALAAVVVPGWGAEDEHYIAVANFLIDKIVEFAVYKIENADTYAEMLFWANWAEFHIQLVLEWLERMIGPFEYEEFEVEVYNEKVGRSVTFDPIHVVGG
jgi:hypothetical protein